MAASHLGWTLASYHADPRPPSSLTRNSAVGRWAATLPSLCFPAAGDPLTAWGGPYTSTRILSLHRTQAVTNRKKSSLFLSCPSSLSLPTPGCLGCSLSGHLSASPDLLAKADPLSVSLLTINLSDLLYNMYENQKSSHLFIGLQVYFHVWSHLNATFLKVGR